MKYLRFFVWCLIFGMFFGCGSKRPEGWPEIFPCKINITENGTPMEGVDVFFTGAANQGSWSVMGRTNSQGDAVMETVWAKGADPGAPAGNFKVTLSKPLPPFIDPTPQATLDTMSYEDRYAHGEKIDAEAAKRKPLIPAELSDAETTPLKIEVKSGEPNEAAFEISQYVKE